MSAFDGNHDGHKSIKELLDEMKFRYADRDDDGVLNRKEFSHVQNAGDFNLYDTNHDALVDPLEYVRGESQERQVKDIIVQQKIN